MSSKKFLSVISGGVGILWALVAVAQPTSPPVVPPVQGETTAPAPPASEDPTWRTLAPEAGGLTAEQVAARALTSSASIRVKRAELEVAIAKMHQTLIQFVPRVTLRASYTRLSPVASDLGPGSLVGALNPGSLTTGPCPPPAAGQCVLDSGGQPVVATRFAIESLQDNYALSASISIPLSDYALRLVHASALVSASRRAAELGVRAEKLRVTTDARVLYYNWIRARGQVSVAEKALERTEARLKDARSAFALGAITRADLLRLEALVSNTELLLAQAQSLEALGKKQLSIAMSDRGPADYRIGEDVLTELAPGTREPLDALTREALAHRVELRALGETTRAFRRGASAVAAGSYPRVEAIGDYTYANPNQRYFPPQSQWKGTWSVGVAATWTIGDSFLNAEASNELEANARVAEAQRDALRDTVTQEVTATYLDRDRSRVAVQTSQRAVQAAEEAYRVATDLYHVGRATTTELIEAESDLLQARLGLLNAQIDLRIATVRLAHAVGRDATAVRGS